MFVVGLEFMEDMFAVMEEVFEFMDMLAMEFFMEFIEFMELFMELFIDPREERGGDVVLPHGLGVAAVVEPQGL